MERGGLRRLLWETIPCRAGADGSLFVGDNLPPGAAEGMPAPEGGPARGWLCVATGGSSGTPKFARHDEATV
ncbi:MAG: hypothetical protein LBR12_02380, partial [Opitutaceae bacterium]|nr:hypothetical protein [Opitutaceae bacterium]